HLQREDRLRLAGEEDRDRPVEEAEPPFVLGHRLVVEGVEDEVPRLRQRTAALEQSRERNPAPDGDRRPALDAVVPRHLPRPAEGAQLLEREPERLLDEPGDLQAVAPEALAGELAIAGAGRRAAVDAVEGRDVPVVEPLARGEGAREHALERVDDVTEQTLRPPAVAQRVDGRGAVD